MLKLDRDMHRLDKRPWSAWLANKGRLGDLSLGSFLCRAPPGTVFHTRPKLAAPGELAMIIRASGHSFGLNGIPLADLDGPHIRRTSLRRNSRMGIVPTRNSNNYCAAALGMTIERNSSRWITEATNQPGTLPCTRADVPCDLSDTEQIFTTGSEYCRVICAQPTSTRCQAPVSGHPRRLPGGRINLWDDYMRRTSHSEPQVHHALLMFTVMILTSVRHRHAVLHSIAGERDKRTAKGRERTEERHFDLVASGWRLVRSFRSLADPGSPAMRRGDQSHEPGRCPFARRASAPLPIPAEMGTSSAIAAASLYVRASRSPRRNNIVPVICAEKRCLLVHERLRCA